MDIIVKLTVPNYIYSFYRDASRNIRGSSPEAVMSDVLAAYAGLISKKDGIIDFTKTPED